MQLHWHRDDLRCDDNVALSAAATSADDLGPVVPVFVFDDDALEHLVDHDTANESGGWQWAASTGTDAQPYFRIFNPMTQGEDYDPDGGYSKTCVDELVDVDADTIHRRHELDPGAHERAAPDYPAPVVDHSERREAASSMYERARTDGR